MNTNNCDDVFPSNVIKTNCRKNCSTKKCCNILSHLTDFSSEHNQDNISRENYTYHKEKKKKKYKTRTCYLIKKIFKIN